MVKLAFSGLAAWAVQRGSAVYMLAWALFVAGSLAVHPRSTFAEWSEWVHSPGISIGSALFFLALYCHMWVGLRDVLLDYAKPASLRHGLLATLAALLVSFAGWALYLLLVPEL
jgi:succinate dehydrogenase / fumarate reductase, membrane anchor subunit